MRKIFFCLCMFFIFLPESGVMSAMRDAPALRKVELLAGFPWTEGLLLTFAADEEQCKARYGQQWRSRCAAALGRPQTTANGIMLSPPAAGYWEWRDTNTLAFIPADSGSIRPDTQYTVDITKLPRPAFVNLDREKISLHTLPLSVRHLSANFLTDPSPAATHRVTADFQFNYPIPKDINPVSLKAPEGGQFGRPEMVWNENRDQLRLSFPVLKLPQQSSRAAIFFEDMGQIDIKDGKISYWLPSHFKNGLAFYQNLPGRDTLFHIKKGEIGQEFNEGLDKEYILSIQTSLYARQEDILKNIIALELPKYNSQEAAVAYNWQNAPGISSDILKKSRQLAVVPVQQDELAKSAFRFRINPGPGRYVLIRIAENLQAASGQKLGRPWLGILRAMESEPGLGFMQSGNILPVAGGGSINIHATDLDYIEWQIQSVREPFLALLAAASANAFENPLGNTALQMENISSTASGRIDLAGKGSGKAQFAALDLVNILKNQGEALPNGLAWVKLTGYAQGEPCARAARMILATNLGLMIKQDASGRLDCFTQFLDNGKIAANAQIRILGANGKPILTGQTDSQGHVLLPSITDFRRESLPVVAVAQLGDDLAWLPLQDKSRELDFSEFPVAGAVHDSRDTNVHLFSERGIYRPGEVIHFGCITRRADFSLLDESAPLAAELEDPRGMKIWDKIFNVGKSGLAALDWQSSENSLSGRYTLTIRAGKNGPVLAAATVRMQEFQPDTLKLKIDAPKYNGWLHTGKGGMAQTDEKRYRGGIFLQNLYGLPAGGHRVKLSLETSPALFQFAGYEDYIFTDAAPFVGQGTSKILGDFKTDEQGQAFYDLPADYLGSSALLALAGEGFEKNGGRAVTARAAILASPMAKILGYRLTGSLTNPAFIPRNASANVEFLALDPMLKRTDWPGLDFSIARCQYVTSLVSDGNGGYRYDEVPVNNPVRSWRQDILSKGTEISLDTGEPGEFLLVARDEEGRIVAKMNYNVAGERLYPPESEPAAGKIRIKTDKTGYQSGDEICLSLSLPYDGSGLITIEREKVLAFEHFSAKAGESVHRITIPKEFEGKGYVVVSYSRAMHSKSVYLSPHSWAIAPFSANISKRDMGLELQAPEKVQPGGSLSVTYSAREPGKAIIFAVDEGILQLTNYQTPNPLATFLADRALGVRSLQAYDLLMPDHGKIAARISAFGGGMDEGAFGRRFENPFKRRNEPPIVFWSGLVDVPAGGATLQISVPDYYNGKLRIMAVGSSPEASGSASCVTTVSAPVVIKPLLPVAVSPGDEFEAGIVVANNTGTDRNLELAASLPASLKMISSLPPRINIMAGKETLLSFRLQALDMPGPAELEISAADGKNYIARRRTELSIRPASALRTTLKAGFASGTTELETGRNIYPHGAQGSMEICAVPVPLANGFASWLYAYPYGCTEQLISRSFAAHLLRAWPQKSLGKAEAQKLFASTLQAIRSRFNGQGVALWPQAEADMLLTAYAVDYLLSLHEAGIGGGEDILEELCAALENQCALNDSSLSSARAVAYAIWTLTRSGRITTQLLENLVQAMEDRAISGWQNDITRMLIAASQREMHIGSQFSVQDIIYRPDGWFDEYAQQSLYMTLLARYFPAECDTARKMAFYEKTAEIMQANSWATFSANQGIRALMTLAASGAVPNIRAALDCAASSQGSDYSSAADGALLRLDAPLCTKYKLDLPPATEPVFWQMITTGYERQPLQEKRSSGIEIERRFLNSDGEEIDSARQGDEITVQITARAMRDSIKDCVIVDLLPGGFEMSMSGKENDPPLPEGARYVDRKEDRMHIFADLTNIPLVFSYKIRPVNCGKFSVPPIIAEAMYDGSAFGNGAAKTMQILQ